MNTKEKAFLDSIKEKIKYYEIETTPREAILSAQGQFYETSYSNGLSELVDIGVERFLCEKSAYYFIDRYAWIDLPGTGVIPFGLYYFQKETLKLLPKTKKTVYLKSRQCGVSTLTSLYCLWRGNFQDSENIDVISTKQQKAQAFVSKMDPTIKRMPEFLKTSIVNKNASVIKWGNGSQILSETASDRAGRGDSLSLLILDEAAHYQTDRLTRGIVAAAMPTLARTGGSSIIISTPNGTSGSGSYYYEQVNSLQINGNSIKEKLVEIDWYEIPDLPGIEPYKGFNEDLEKFVAMDYFNNPSIKQKMREHFSSITENWRDNEWLTKQHEDLGDVLFKQEVLHSFIIADDQVFPEEVLEKVKDNISGIVPIWENKLNTNPVKGMIVWELPKPKHRYILGIDVGSGTSKDFSTIQVMDVELYSQVAEYKGKMSTKLLGRLVKMVAKYYNQGFVVIEANSIGEAVFNEVYYHDTDPYDNVYKQKKQKNGVTRMTGWETNVKTRQLMTNNIIDWFTVDDLFNQMTIRSQRLYQELCTWVWHGSKPEHAEGSHDDALIAWGLCIHLRNKADSFGESFFIGDDGGMFEYSEKDSKDMKESEDELAIAMSDYDAESLEDSIKETYNVESVEQYNFLIGE